MNCPNCGKDNNYVVDHSRKEIEISGENIVTRKRICNNCGHKFTTVERWRNDEQ